MAKPTKSERKALDALTDAAGAAKTARKVAKDLSDEPAKSLRKAAEKAKDVAETSKKQVRKHPKQVRKRAEQATNRVLQATEQALATTEQKVHEEAAQEPADVAAPAPEPTEDLALLTVAQLHERARSQGRVGFSRLSKAELVEFLA